MSDCPICGSSISDDFGMQACESCGAFLFVDMNGHIDVDFDQNHQDQAETNSVDIEGQELVNNEQGQESVDNEQEEDFSNFEKSQVDDSLNQSEDEIVSQFEESDEKDQLQSNEFHSIETGLDGSSDFSDVSEYANSELSTAREGLYLYTLTISDIDSAYLRKEIEEALTDVRFKWDRELLVNKIKDGVLVIENINAVKASVLVNRLKSLSVRVDWSQHAIVQA